MATCSPSTLMASAKCFSGLTDGQLKMIIIQLLCEINAGGGGGGGTQWVYSGNYGGVKPVFTPAGAQAVAFDTTDGTQYNYYSGTWH